ncbi:MAG: hypothetical protein RI884_258 [Pseudomonadota bacterium]|jgi:hypothetical protein
MLKDASMRLCLVGCGEVFDLLDKDLSTYGWDDARVHRHRFEQVADIAAQADAVLASWDPAVHTLFIAVDANALNHARLELYGRARLRGFRLQALVHPSVIAAPGTRWADNVWIGPGTLLGPDCRIDSDSFIGAGSRLDARVHVGAHVWVGQGARIGTGCQIATHAVLGPDVMLKPGTQLGRHVLIDKPGPWEGTWAAGTFLESTWAQPARMMGPGYSFQRQTPP